jgi:hypothetical protein
MIRKSELLRLLAAVPGDPVVTVWQNATRMPVDGCDSDIEQIVACENERDGGTVIVLGLDIPASVLPDGETVWGGK